MTQTTAQTVHPASLALLQTLITDWYPDSGGVVIGKNGDVTHLLLGGVLVPLAPVETEDSRNDEEPTPSAGERMLELVHHEMSMGRIRANQHLSADQVVTWPQGTLPLPAILAEVHDDARSARVDFNAAPYFASLSDRELMVFIKEAFKDTYETDFIAETLAESDAELAEFFNRKPNRYNGETNGFECTYANWPLACHSYLSRPHLRGLMARVLSEEEDEDALDTEIAALSSTAPVPAEGSVLYRVQVAVYARTAEELDAFVEGLQARTAREKDLVIEAEKVQRHFLGSNPDADLQALALKN